MATGALIGAPESGSSPRAVLTLGVVRYLNARPLTVALEGRAGLTLVPDVPSRLVERFRDGHLDAALLPVMAWFDGVGAAIVPGIGVCSSGPVESVRLFCRRPLRETRRVLLDRESVTSNTLCRILLRRALELRPEFVVPGIDARPADGDAELRIGDKGMADDPAAVETVDLGEAWQRWTGLPFVYAAWIARADRPAAGLTALLHDALETGLPRIPTLAAEGARATGLPPPRCERYLRDRIRYRVGEAEISGLVRFGEEACREHGTPAARPLRWLA